MHLLCSIRCEPKTSRYEFLVRETSRSRIVASADLSVDAADRSRLDQLLEAMRKGAEPLGGGDLTWVRDGLAHLSYLLASVFLPADVRGALASAALQGATLLIETNESRIPWELAAVDGVPLWRRFAVARRELVAVRPGAGLAPSLRGAVAGGAERLRVLVIADPQSGRPTAVVEARRIASRMARRGETEIDVLLGHEATVENVVARLSTGAYGVIHIDALSEYNPTNPQHSYIELADDDLPASRLFDLRLPVRPHLVFFQCPPHAYVPSRGFLTHASGWGRLFLDLGAETVVTTAWSPPPERAAAVTEAFYDAFARGTGAGEALRGARGAVSDEAAYTVCGYMMHGNPALAIAPMGVSAAATAASRETEEWVPQSRFVLRITHGPSSGRVIPLVARTMLQGRRILIGSVGARANEIDLGDPALSNDEAYLEYDRGHYVLHNQCGASHTRVNGSKVVDPVPLAAGDVVEMGASVIAFDEAGGAPSQSVEPRVRARFSLQVLEPDGSGVVSTHPLSHSAALLGRLAECAVRLDDAAVSRRHALVSPRDQGWFVQPVGYRPVLVNGVVVLTERRLEHGDEIQLSPSALVRFVDAEKEVF